MLCRLLSSDVVVVVCAGRIVDVGMDDVEVWMSISKQNAVRSLQSNRSAVFQML